MDTDRHSQGGSGTPGRAAGFRHPRRGSKEAGCPGPSADRIFLLSELLPGAAWVQWTISGGAYGLAPVSAHADPGRDAAAAGAPARPFELLFSRAHLPHRVPCGGLRRLCQRPLWKKTLRRSRMIWWQILPESVPIM